MQIIKQNRKDRAMVAIGFNGVIATADAGLNKGLP
jgi:hypothetical protein